jgi:sugar transferase (PEP-CTERM/EpsH1 system associated)
MKILFLTPQIPYPPQKGTALRNWGLIEGLAPNHQVCLQSFRAPGQDEASLPLLEACEVVETMPQPTRTRFGRLRDMLLTPHPDMALRLASDAFAERLERWLARERFDIVQIEGIELAPYLEIVEAAENRPFVVFDDHNCEYLLQKRAFLTDLGIPARWPSAGYSFVQWRRLRGYEAHICRRADHVLAVSDADASALRKLTHNQLDVTVIPNGIDTRAYQPTSSEADAPTLVFTGTMDFRPNVDAVLWFARQVLPHISAAVPDVRFIIVGQRPHRRLDPLRENPAVTLTGWVEDPRPYIAEATVYVAPLRMGGGTRLKLLEAMSMSKPMVATRLGAEGYPVTDGRELLLADTPTDFAAAVVSLLQAPARRTELGQVARAFVERRYDWRVIVPQVEAVYSAHLKHVKGLY